MAAPNGAPPVTCADGQIRLSQDAVDLLNGQKTLNSDISQQNLSLLAAEAAARCGQMESTQQVVETEAGGIAVVSTMSPKDLWDTLSQMLNHDQPAPRGNRIVEPAADTTVDGRGARLTSGVAVADDAAALKDAPDTSIMQFPETPKPPKGTADGDLWRFQRYQADGGMLRYDDWYSLSRGGRSGSPTHQ